MRKGGLYASEHLHQIPISLVRKRQSDRLICLAYKSKEMKTAIAFFSMFAALEDRFIFVELSFFNGYINPYDVLPDNTSGTNVQVTICGDQSELVNR